MSDHPNMPPGANADLLRIEREQEEFDKRLAEIEREMRNDPQVIIDNLDEDEIARRLRRVLRRISERHSYSHEHFMDACEFEWYAAITEALTNWRKSEVIET
jgi:hypothetical protein